jgi:hypothetical protein
LLGARTRRKRAQRGEQQRAAAFEHGYIAALDASAERTAADGCWMAHHAHAD